MAFNHPPSYLLTAALNFSMNMRTEMLREANAFRSMVYMRHVQSHERASAAMATCAECYPLAPDAGSSNAIGPVALSPAQRFWYSLIQSAQSLAWSSRSSSSMSAAVHTSVPTTSGSGAGPLLDFVVSMQGEWRMAFAMMTEQRYAEVQLGMDALVGHNWQVGLANHLHGTGVSEWQQLLLDVCLFFSSDLPHTHTHTSATQQLFVHPPTPPFQRPLPAQRRGQPQLYTALWRALLPSLFWICEHCCPGDCGGLTWGRRGQLTSVSVSLFR